MPKDSNIHKIERVDEVFKTIEGFTNYEVSNLGKIRSKARLDSRGQRLKARIMKQRLNKREGFMFLDLIDDQGKRRTVYPHKEVAKAFCINVLPEERNVVIHLDGDLLNNDSSNLDWANYSEAMRLQFKLGKKDNYKVWKERKKRYKNGFKKGGEKGKKTEANASIPKEDKVTA